MLTAPVLAASGNSPTFLGHRLWHETRVALFKQAGDDRPPDRTPSGGMPPRVGFGNGWVREGALELFCESVALHEPLLPVCGGENPRACARAGGIPRLDELRLHHGTVWKWNRPVYDPAYGGHLRIELRALPSGPTLCDMLANAAFLVGGHVRAGGRGARAPAFAAVRARRAQLLPALRSTGSMPSWRGRRIPGAAPAQVRARDLAVSCSRAEAG